MREDISKKIILALDPPDLKKAESVLDELKDCLKIVKIGSATFYRWGDSILKLLKGRKLGIFIDFKFHDIPNTVAAAAEGIVPWGIDMFTVHIMGGRNMLQAVTRRTKESSEKLNLPKPMVLGISVLTSLDEEMINQDLKIPVRLQALISNLANLARESGLDGIVASPHEIDLIRSVVGKDLKIVCPGIRAPGESSGDQKRTLSAGEAIRKGADFVVIGRPLYEAQNPRDVYEGIVEEILNGVA
jgi:orotidine-5'-phosphate decarboxylase